MHSIIPDREPRSTLYDLMIEYPARDGKGLRPALCLSACQLFGGSIEACLNSATAIELYHNSFLVHDDLEDGSTHRRGKPTLWVEHGLPVAVNVGDGLMVMAIKPLINNIEFIGVDKTFKVIREIVNMAQYSSEGQAIELGWVRDNQWKLTERDYLLMCLKKTCWYTCMTPCRVGAIIAGAKWPHVIAFNKIGYHLGIAFQIQDDILNLIGDEGLYGKESAGDIWEGKRTLILIHLLNTLKGHELEKTLRILATPREAKEPRDVYWVLQKMHDYGSIEYAKKFAFNFALVCEEHLEKLLAGTPHNEHADFLREVVYYVIERDL
ncbi:MAG: polyprenyl synthetase family protein [Candidatus Saccharibacteria bacterium]